MGRDGLRQQLVKNGEEQQQEVSLSERGLVMQWRKRAVNCFCS